MHLCVTIDKKGEEEGSEMAVLGVFLFFFLRIGEPLVNLLCKIVLFVYDVITYSLIGCSVWICTALVALLIRGVP